MEFDDFYEVNLAESPEFGAHRDHFCMKGSAKAQNHPEKEDYGLSPENPLYFRNFSSAERFLSLLKTDKGEICEHEPAQSDEDPYGAVLEEIAISVNGDYIKELFICYYGTENAKVAPKGFVLDESWDPDCFVNDPSLVECRYDIPESKDMQAISIPWNGNAGFYIGEEFYRQPISLSDELCKDIPEDLLELADRMKARAKDYRSAYCPLKNVYIDFIYESRFYRMYPSFIGTEDTVFEALVPNICEILSFLGSPYYRYCGMLD